MKRLISSILLIFIMTILTGCSVREASSYYHSGKESFLSGDYENAAQNFSYAISRHPHRADYYIDYGMALIALGKYEDAIEQFNKAYIDKDIKVVKENNKRIHRGKAFAYYYMGDFYSALQEFDLALGISELLGLDKDIMYFKGDVLTTIGLYGDALEVFYEIIENVDSNYAKAYERRAYIFRSLGEYSNSLKDYDKAISLDKSNYEFYFAKYYLLLEMGDALAAQEVLSLASELKANTKEDQFYQAKILYYKEAFDVALPLLLEAFEHGFIEANYYLGQIHLQRKEYRMAIYYFENYINSNNSIDHANAYNQLGLCFIKVSDYSRALTYVERGKALHDDRILKGLLQIEIMAYEGLDQLYIVNEKLNEYVTRYPEDLNEESTDEFLKNRIQ